MALGAAGCRADDTSFLARSQQDCQRGDQQACRMLDDLSHPQQAAEPRLPSMAAPLTQVQRDVAAILQGMRRARDSRSAGTIAPPDAGI